MTEMPQRFAATGADAAISITRAVTHHRIGLSLAFTGQRLDASRLARALRLSLDAEPVAGCAFCTDERRAYWRRIPDLEGAAILLEQDCADPKATMRSFQAVEITDEGPQAAAVLLHASEGDYLGIKMSHVLGDGQAAKRYAYLIADIYSELARDGSYVPEPNLRPRPSGRDVWANLDPQQRRNAKKAKSWAKATWPAEAGSAGRDLTYRRMTLSPERFSALKAYGSKRGCSVNDMMLTAVLRACVSRLDPPTGIPLSLMYTADLRRYLADDDALPLCNLSISGSLGIERIDGEGFDDTLARVHGRMEEWAKMCHGAGPLANAERLASLGYKTTERLLRMAFRAGRAPDKTYPWFTNIGIVDDVRLSFDGMAPSSAYMFGPASSGASIVPVISTYRDELTVSMGFCASDLDAAVVEELLDAVADEVEVACAAECVYQAHPADGQQS